MGLTNKKGFTLVELIMVIAILGFLSVAAIPSFINVRDDADINVRMMLIGSIQEGIQLYAANNILNGGGFEGPDTLGSPGLGVSCSEDTGCFGSILNEALHDPRWKMVGKGGDLEYWGFYPDPSNLPLWLVQYEYNSADSTFQFESEQGAPEGPP